MTPFVDLRTVSLAYGGKTGTLALERASLSVAEGSFAALVGPSGCGKTSLLRVVAGLEPVTGGTVQVDGRAVAGPLKILGMAFQNATLLPWRTTLENVLLPVEVSEPTRRGFRRERAGHAAAARALLAEVGLAGYENRPPRELSGGMQSRAALCRAIVHDPRLVLLDEPFAALDAFTREELWTLVQTLWLQKRFTAILVTHDLREAVYLADTVHVMGGRPGRIVHRRDIPLPRPRTLDMTFAPDFVAIVQDLRTRIGAVRTG